MQYPMMREDVFEGAKDLTRVIRYHMDQEGDKETVLLNVWPEIVKAGFNRLLVDSRFGGLGLDLKSYVYAIRQLAYGDGALALAVHVHNYAVSIVNELGKEAFRERLKKWLDEGRLFALARSEYGRDYRYDFSTRIAHTDSAMILSGQKDFCTLAGLADYYVVFAQTEESRPAMDSLQVCLARGKHPAVETIRSNRLEAMAASSTYSVRFHDYVLSPADLAGKPGDIAGLTNPDTLTLGICAMNIGMSDWGIELFVEKERQRCSMNGQNAEVLRWIGHVDVLLHSAQLLLDESIGSRPGTGQDSGIRLRRAKAASDLLIQEVTEGAIRYLGMEGMISPSPFIYLRNNAYAARLLPPNNQKCLLALGTAKIK